MLRDSGRKENYPQVLPEKSNVSRRITSSGRSSRSSQDTTDVRVLVLPSSSLHERAGLPCPDWTALRTSWLSKAPKEMMYVLSLSTLPGSTRASPMLGSTLSGQLSFHLLVHPFSSTAAILHRRLVLLWQKQPPQSGTTLV